MSKLFLGIDGGQSSTVILIGDENGRVIGWARGGPCNHVASEEAAGKFRSVITECLLSACQSAGLDQADVCFEAACCGMSGGPLDKRAILASLIRAKQLIVTDDGVIALSGALGGNDGAVVISGTGSIAYGRDRTGKMVRAGGWGYIYGDEGSAFDIARQAARAILRHAEGWGPATQLTEALLQASGVEDANEMLHLFYKPDWPRSRVAKLSELVDSVSEQGDFVAREILVHAASALASLVMSVRTQLLAAPTITYLGGTFRSATLLAAFRELVGACQPPLFGPSAGALLEAYAATGRTVELTNAPALK